MRRHLAVIGALAVVAAVLAPTGATACENGVEVVIDPRVSQLQAADLKVAQGDAAGGARIAHRLFPRLRAAALAPAGRNGPSFPDRLLARALRVVAIAEARADGGLALGPDFAVATEHDREANYDWAVSTLRRLQLRRLNDPAPLTDLGEALARRAKYGEEARRMLEFLAEGDVMTSAEGWAALARLRATAAEGSRSEEAAARCEQMAKDKSICRAQDGKTGS